ncbi:MAG: aldo/keto reductase [Candidatus Marinimicrobia bacterium]|nr:aldo/keto reductase [Candidatus Neomarinimicrobiota bacterium]
MKRVLGRSGIEISALGLGCWAIGGPFWSGETPNGWGEVDDAESIRAIHIALDSGITFFDTANVYGAGHSEKILGKAVGSRRADVVIATKFSAVFDEETRQVLREDATPSGIRSALEDSLRRLNTDYIDLYQFHNNGFPASEAGTVRDTLEALVAEGKIRTYGWSTDFSDRAAVFAQGKNCTAIQLQLNVLDDNPELIQLCEQEDLAAINRGPLAMGVLTKKYASTTEVPIDDVRGKNSPDWMGYFKHGRPNQTFLDMRDSIVEILTSDGRTLAQGALAWLWGRSSKTIPIPGFRTERQVLENVAAMTFGPLSNDQMNEIDQLLNR